MSKRLQLLEGSLTKKQARLDRLTEQHRADVMAANGQPMNDKRNGKMTLSRWDRQLTAIARQKDSVRITEEAIEREKAKIGWVEALDLPPPLRLAVESGELLQWRRNPRFFFVRGVDQARIVYDPKTGKIGHRYVSDAPRDQYPRFRDAYNRLRLELEE
jgi:hypothetical protein